MTGVAKTVQKQPPAECPDKPRSILDWKPWMARKRKGRPPRSKPIEYRELAGALAFWPASLRKRGT